jgi:hypothetical protein
VKYALLQGSLYGADEKRVAIQTTREVKKAIGTAELRADLEKVLSRHFAPPRRLIE